MCEKLDKIPMYRSRQIATLSKSQSWFCSYLRGPECPGSTDRLRFCRWSRLLVLVDQLPVSHARGRNGNGTCVLALGLSQASTKIYENRSNRSFFRYFVPKRWFKLGRLTRKLKCSIFSIFIHHSTKGSLNFLYNQSWGEKNCDMEKKRTWRIKNFIFFIIVQKELESIPLFNCQEKKPKTTKTWCISDIAKFLYSSVYLDNVTIDRIVWHRKQPKPSLRQSNSFVWNPWN